MACRGHFLCHDTVRTLSKIA